VSVIDFKDEKIQCGNVVTAAGMSPTVRNGLIGIPATGKRSGLNLAGDQKRFEGVFPSLPIVPVDVEHDLRGVVPVIDVPERSGSRAHLG
jgi:hypothetical protein